MSADWHGRAIDAAAQVIAENAALLTDLDSAIGDGDHGTNMKRGFNAVAAERDAIADLPTGQALMKAGMTLVSKVGGASGPLYGSLLMSMGKTLDEGPLDLHDFSKAFRAGVEAVMARGKATTGEKTMLDVLVPVADALERAAAEGVSGAELANSLRGTARTQLEATRDMQATKGRAAYLGERSRGHLDPGAQSSCLLIDTACQIYEEKG